MSLCFAAAQNVVRKPFGVLGLLLSSTLLLVLNNGGALQTRGMFGAEAVPVTEAALLVEKRSAPEWAVGGGAGEAAEQEEERTTLFRQKRELDEAKLVEQQEDEEGSPGTFTDFDGQF